MMLTVNDIIITMQFLARRVLVD